MKTLGFELTVPFLYRNKLRRQLHQAIDDMIASEIPAYIKEEKSLKKSKFTLIYHPTNFEQLKSIKDFERQIGSLVYMFNER